MSAKKVGLWKGNRVIQKEQIKGNCSVRLEYCRGRLFWLARREKIERAEISNYSKIFVFHFQHCKVDTLKIGHTDNKIVPPFLEN